MTAVVAMKTKIGNAIRSEMARRLNIRALPRRRAPVDQQAVDPVEECPVLTRHEQSGKWRLSATYRGKARTTAT